MGLISIVGTKLAITNPSNRTKSKQKQKDNMSNNEPIALDQLEEKSTTFFEMPEQPVTLLILAGTVEESTDGNSFIIKWEMEGKAPATVLDKAGNQQGFNGLPWNPWWYLPKSGRNQAGKVSGAWTRLNSLAKKLNVSMAGVSTHNVPQAFVNAFVGKAFVAEDFTGERKAKKKGGQPVIDEVSGEVKTIVEYNFWRVKEAAPRYNA